MTVTRGWGTAAWRHPALLVPVTRYSDPRAFRDAMQRAIAEQGSLENFRKVVKADLAALGRLHHDPVPSAA